MKTKLKCGVIAGIIALSFSLLCIEPTHAECAESNPNCHASSSVVSVDELDEETASVPNTGIFTTDEEASLMSNSGLIVTITILSLVLAVYGAIKYAKQ